MNPDDPREQLSHLFDDREPVNHPPGTWQQDDWDAWSAIESHLATRAVVALPADFTRQVQLAAKRAQRRKDALLVLQVAAITGVILTSVVASALGADWWQRLVAGLQPANIAEWFSRAAAQAAPALPAFSRLAGFTERAWRFLPLTLFVAAVLSIAIELVVFRLLHVGPFHRRSTHHDSNLPL